MAGLETVRSAGVKSAGVGITVCTTHARSGRGPEDLTNLGADRDRIRTPLEVLCAAGNSVRRRSIFAWVSPMPARTHSNIADRRHPGQLSKADSSSSVQSDIGSQSS